MSAGQPDVDNIRADDQFEIDVVIRADRLKTLGATVLLAAIAAFLYYWVGGISLHLILIVCVAPFLVWNLIVGPKTLRVTHEYATVFCSGIEQSRHRMSDLIEIRSFLPGAFKLVFSDGFRISVSTFRDDGQIALEYLGLLLAKRAAVHSAPSDVLENPHLIEIVFATLQFPQGRCVSCNRATDNIHLMYARRGIRMGESEMSDVRELAVPVCIPCVRWRKVAMALCLLLMGAVIGAMFFHAEIAQALGIPPGVPWPEVVIVSVIILFILFQNFGGSILDRWMLGLSFGRMSPDLTRCRLYIRDRELAAWIKEKNSLLPK